MWIETYYFFQKEKLTTQELTKIELGQLLDLRTEWADNITIEVISCNYREPPPIRIISEISIAGDYWLRTLDLVQNPPTLYFRDSCPPWLSTAGSTEYPTMKIEGLAFFSWLWEP